MDLAASTDTAISGMSDLDDAHLVDLPILSILFMPPGHGVLFMPSVEPHSRVCTLMGHPGSFSWTRPSFRAASGTRWRCVHRCVCMWSARRCVLCRVWCVELRCVDAHTTRSCVLLFALVCRACSEISDAAYAVVVVVLVAVAVGLMCGGWVISACLLFVCQMRCPRCPRECTAVLDLVCVVASNAFPPLRSRTRSSPSQRRALASAPYRHRPR